MAINQRIVDEIVTRPGQDSFDRSRIVNEIKVSISHNRPYRTESGEIVDVETRQAILSALGDILSGETPDQIARREAYRARRAQKDAR